MEMHPHLLTSPWSFPGWREGRRRSWEVGFCPLRGSLVLLGFRLGRDSGSSGFPTLAEGRRCLSPTLDAPCSRCPRNCFCPMFLFKRYLKQAQHCQDKTSYRIFLHSRPHEIFSFGGHCRDLMVLHEVFFSQMWNQSDLNSYLCIAGTSRHVALR